MLGHALKALYTEGKELTLKNLAAALSQEAEEPVSIAKVRQWLKDLDCKLKTTVSIVGIDPPPTAVPMMMRPTVAEEPTVEEEMVFDNPPSRPSLPDVVSSMEGPGRDILPGGVPRPQYLGA